MDRLTFKCFKCGNDICECILEYNNFTKDEKFPTGCLFPGLEIEGKELIPDWTLDKFEKDFEKLEKEIK